MKLLLAAVGFVLLASNGINADKALADQLKPFEAFSPYEWTKWVELRPPQHRPFVSAAVSFSPYGYEQDAAAQVPPPSAVDSDDSSEEDDEDDSVEAAVSPFEQWFKRAILPQPPVTKKPKKLKDPLATKKPSIVDVPLDFWGPPPSIAPNVTLPPPPGYYAAKKSMFISKLFAALAASVLNSTGAPDLTGLPTTTVSPRQAILNEIESVLLSDVARSLPPQSVEDSDETEESDEDSEEVVTVPTTTTTTTTTTTAAPITTTTTENPFLLKKLDFLEKLTAAVLAQPLVPVTATPVVVTPAPTTPAPTKAPKGKAGKAGKKAKGKKAPTTPKPPKWLKYQPTTTTTAAPPVIDYDALAKALLSGQK